MTTTFLGGIQLVNGIQVHAYKNDEQHWLSLYKDDRFIDFITHGPEINGLTASLDGKWFAYFQRNPQKNMTEFVVWKYSQISDKEHEIEPYTQVNIPINDFTDIQACFNSVGTHVACLGEWNRVHVIDLRRLDSPTEFYIPNSCDEIKQQVICDAGDCFAWAGQDEFLRVIDLTAKHPTMWRCKLKNTKYLFVHNNHVIHMTDAGIIGVFNVNLREKRLGICYDVKYPTGKYEDITIEEYGRVILHKKGGQKYALDWTCS
jgi:hypothetical protein